MLGSGSILMIHELRIKGKSIRAISQEIGHSLPLFPKKAPSHDFVSIAKIPFIFNTSKSQYEYQKYSDICY